MHRLTVFFVILMVPILVSCSQEEPVKTIRLDKRGTANEITITPTPSDPDILRFGFDLRLSPREDVAIYLPFLRYLERQTGLKFNLDFTANYQKTIENLGKGITSFAALGPVNCVRAKNLYGVDCLVTGLNTESSSQYKAVIITRMDSPLHDIGDLGGRSFAFGDRFSTQGHVIPRKMLEDAGITLDELSRFAFTGSHAATVRAVLNGEYDAGGVQDELAWRLAAEGTLRVLVVSKPYPSSLICYSPAVPANQVEMVKKALLDFDPRGRDSSNLKDWDQTEMAYGFATSNAEALKEIEKLAKQYGVMEE